MKCLSDRRTLHQKHSAFARGPVTLGMSAKRHARPSLSCATAAGSSLSLHIGETTVTLPFTITAAKELEASVTALLQTFAAKQQAERPKRWEAMEYRLKSDAGDGDVKFFEVFCNPNAYSSAFDAKVLITIKGNEGIHITTEGRLSNFKADLDTYLSH